MGHDAAAIAEQLNAAGIPAGPLNSIAEIVADGHVRARGIVRHIADDADNVVATAAPVRTRGSAASIAAESLELDDAGVIGADSAAIRAESRRS